MGELEKVVNDLEKPLDSYEKNDLAAVLTSASSLLKPAEEMISNLDYARTMLITDKKKIDWNSTSLWLAIFVVFPYIFVLVGVMMLLAERSIIPLSIFLIGFLGVAIQIIIILNYRKYNKESKELWESSCENHENSISVYMEEKLRNSIAAIIPPDFRYSVILDYMANYIRNMEAYTWRECVALWKTDAHRAKLEESAEITRIYAMQSAVNSAEAAMNANAAARSANVAMWLSFWGRM